jgi:hypothetical protein
LRRGKGGQEKYVGFFWRGDRAVDSRDEECVVGCFEGEMISEDATVLIQQTAVAGLSKNGTDL